MVIEEARAMIMWPAVKTQQWGNTHAAAFTASMRPGGWGVGYDPGTGRHYRFVNLLFQTGAYYEDYIDPWAPYYWYFLTHADLDLKGGGNDVYYDLDDFKSKCGLDTGSKELTLMNDLLWWTVGTVAGAVPVVGVVIGPGIGLIPILVEYFNPTYSYVGKGFDHIYALGTYVDADSDDRGTVSFFVQIRFYGQEGQGWRSYTFTSSMASWLGYMYTQTGYIVWRFSDIPYNRDITFNVYW